MTHLAFLERATCLNVAPRARLTLRVALAAALLAGLAGCTQRHKASSAPLTENGEKIKEVELQIQAAPYRGMAEILTQSKPEEWQKLAASQLLVMRIAKPAGQTGAAEPIIILLADAFAPLHTQNLRTLSRQHYFDGLSIMRSQDNFVVQWGDPEEKAELKKSLGAVASTLPAEFVRTGWATLDFTRLPDADGYAPEVGFSAGFAVGRDPSEQSIWPAHCYGVVGAGRDEAETSGIGSELYVVTGHAPRQLDRNIAVVGRVVSGIEQLSVAPRGPAPMGFYQNPEQRIKIESIRLASELPLAQQPNLEALLSSSTSFSELIEARRNRGDSWYKRKAGHIDLCNVPLPVRARTALK